MRCAAPTFLMVCAFGLAAYAAEAPPTGPQATAPQLRASRASLRMPAHKVIFDVTEDDKGTHEKVVLILGQDVLEVSRGSVERLYDFTLRRIISIDRTTQSFANGSLYANPAARIFEAQNRVFMSRALEAAKITTRPESLDPFWVASELGVVVGMPNQTPAQIDRQSGPDGSLAFVYAGQEVAHAVFSSWRLPPDEQKRFASFLRFESALHPDIVAALTEVGRIPRSLVFERIAGPKRSRVTYDLASVEAVEFEYPLPAGYRAEPLPARAGDRESEAFRPLVQIMLQAVALRYGNGPRPVADYETAIDRALTARQGFQALLLVTELQLQYGLQAANCEAAPPPTPCHPLREIGPAIGGDARVRSYMEAVQAEQANHDAAKAIAVRRAIPHDDVTNGYILDDQIANAMTAKGTMGSDTFSLFANAIRGDPYVATFYKDLGDYFTHEFRTDLAWLCFDLGRALPGGNATPMLPSITNFEKQLVAKYPQFF